MYRQDPTPGPPNKKRPPNFPEAVGWSNVRNDLLARQNLLREPDRVDRLQLWRLRRQICRAKREVQIEVIVARVGRSIHTGSLVRTHSLAIVVETHHGTLIVAHNAPIFDEAQEVVYAAIRSEVVRCANLRKRYPLSANDRVAIRRGNGVPINARDNLGKSE